MMEYLNNEVQLLDLNSMNLISEWKKIELFLDEQTKLFHEVIENPTNRASFMLDSERLKTTYEANFNRLKDYIETGIKTGEFAPQYPVSICVDMLMTTLEGLHSNSRFIYTEKNIVSEQMKVIKEQLKEVLVVI